MSRESLLEFTQGRLKHLEGNAKVTPMTERIQGLLVENLRELQDIITAHTDGDLRVGDYVILPTADILKKVAESYRSQEVDHIQAMAGCVAHIDNLYARILPNGDIAPMYSYYVDREDHMHVPRALNAGGMALPREYLIKVGEEKPTGEIPFSIGAKVKIQKKFGAGGKPFPDGSDKWTSDLIGKVGIIRGCTDARSKHSRNHEYTVDWYSSNEKGEPFEFYHTSKGLWKVFIERTD